MMRTFDSGESERRQRIARLLLATTLVLLGVWIVHGFLPWCGRR